MKSPSLFQSFRNAWRGILLCFRSERSFRLQTAAALFMMGLVLVVDLTSGERIAILFVAMFVLVLELINSSVERLVDLLKPRLHEYAGDIKDLMAGAVLLASLFALLIGVVIFAPHALSTLRHL